jgi:hypothetical protein
LKVGLGLADIFDLPRAFDFALDRDGAAIVELFEAFEQLREVDLS